MGIIATKHLISFNGGLVTKAHTTAAGCAFGIALLFTLILNYRQSVGNELFEYPKEWFPSVTTTTTGGGYPYRSIFQLFIAIASGPRFILVFLWYLLVRPVTDDDPQMRPRLFLILGLARTFAVGFMAYVPDGDDHDLHDLAMICYGILSIWWMAVVTYISQIEQMKLKRKRICQFFMLLFIPLGHFFIQHRLYQLPGALSKYALCEWGLVVLDVYFDSLSVYEFSKLEFEISGPRSNNYSEKPGIV